MKKSFEKIYADYYHAILTHLLAKTNNNITLCEELTNDVFVKVYNKLENYNENLGKISTWIYTIANNHLIDHYRKNRKNKEYSIDNNINKNDYDLYSHECTPEEKMINSELNNKIRRAVNNIKLTSHKRIFILRYYNQKSYEEISELLGVNIGTVKGTIYRIREQLTKELADEYTR